MLLVVAILDRSAHGEDLTGQLIARTTVPDIGARPFTLNHVVPVGRLPNESYDVWFSRSQLKGGRR
jgi:hypothetical protein